MTEPLSHSALLGPLFASEAMSAITDDRARLQRMLDVEATLARAQAALGIVPTSAVEPIARACRAERYDIAAIGTAAVLAGDIAVPLIKALTAEVAREHPAAAGYVHWGATSQDIIDTAQVLELRAAIDALLVDLDAAIEGFVALASRHRRLPTVARTWMQHALPIPFGLKLAGYAATLGRSRERLKRLRREALVLQFGGAAGTLAALGDRGFDVGQRLAALLDLPLPDAPWHGHRDRLAEIASAFAILAGSCGKIARDVSLLMQTDVGEAFEPAGAGRGGSTTMPHKRNPVAAVAALAAATLAPNLAASVLAALVGEHERAAGAWQAEWPLFPALACVTSAALASMVDLAEGLEVDAERMRANLESTDGLIMAETVAFALAAKIGKAEAHALVEEASRRAVAENIPLEKLLTADERVTAHLPAVEIRKLFEPMAYQGAAQAFIERQIAPLMSRGKRLAQEERRAAAPASPEIAAPAMSPVTVDSDPDTAPQDPPQPFETAPEIQHASEPDAAEHGEDDNDKGGVQAPSQGD